MSDLTIDNLKHVYSKSDLLNFAKDEDNFLHVYNHAIDLGYEEDKANEITYDFMREWSLKQKDEDGILLKDKYPLRNIPTWFQFGDKDTITRARLVQYDNNPTEMSEVYFNAGEIDNILSDQSTYQPGKLAAAFSKHSARLLYDDPEKEKEVEMWLLNNLSSAQTYLLKESTVPFPQALDYHPDWKDMTAQFFSMFLEGPSLIGMLGGSFLGRTISKPIGQYGSKYILEHSPKTLAAYGLTRNFKEGLKNRMKKAIGLNYDKLPKSQWGGLATRQELIDNGVEFMTRNSEHFGSWYGFTWYSGYQQDLVMQKWENIDNGNPDKPLSTMNAIKSATWHSTQEGFKGMLMGYPLHKMSKINAANGAIAGNAQNSMLNILKGKKQVESMKYLSTSALPRFGTEVFSLSALTELQHGIQRTTKGETFFDWDLIEKDGGLFNYSRKILLTNTAILGGFKASQTPYHISQKFTNWVLKNKIKALKGEIELEKNRLKEFESNAESIKGVDGSEIEIGIEVKADIKNKILEKQELLQNLINQSILGESINPYGSEFMRTVEDMINDPEMKSQQTLQYITEYWGANRHRVEILLENPKQLRAEIKRYLKDMYGKDVELTDVFVDEIVGMVKSSIETTSSYIDKINEKSQTQGGANEGKVKLTEENKANDIKVWEKENENLIVEILTRDKDKKEIIEGYEKNVKDQKMTVEVFNQLLKQMLNDIDKSGIIITKAEREAKKSIEKEKEFDIESSLEEIAHIESKLYNRKIEVEDIRKDKSLHSPVLGPGGKIILSPIKVKERLAKRKLDAKKDADRPERAKLEIEESEWISIKDKNNKDITLDEAIEQGLVPENVQTKLKRKIGGKVPVKDYLNDALKNGEISQNLYNEILLGIEKYDNVQAPKTMETIINYAKFLHKKGFKSLSEANRDLTREYIEQQFKKRGDFNEATFNNHLSKFFGTGQEGGGQIHIEKGWAFDFMKKTASDLIPTVSNIGKSRKSKPADIENIGGLSGQEYVKFVNAKNLFIKNNKGKTIKVNKQTISYEVYDAIENLLYITGARAPLLFRYLKIENIDWNQGTIKQVKTGAGKKGLNDLTNFPIREISPELFRQLQILKGGRDSGALFVDINGKRITSKTGRELINKVNEMIIETLPKDVKFRGEKGRVIEFQDYRRMILTDAGEMGMMPKIDEAVVKHSQQTVPERYDLSLRGDKTRIAEEFYKLRKNIKHNENIIELHGGLFITAKTAKDIMDAGKKLIVRGMERLAEINRRKNKTPDMFSQELLNNEAIYTIAATESLSKVLGKINEFENFSIQIQKDIPYLKNLKNKDKAIEKLYKDATNLLKDPEGTIKGYRKQILKNFHRYLKQQNISTKDKDAKTDAIIEILSKATDKQLKRFTNINDLAKFRLGKDVTLNDMLEFNTLITDLSPVAKMTTTNKNTFVKLAQRIKDYATDFYIKDSELIKILKAHGVIEGKDINHTIARASLEQLMHVETYLLNNINQTVLSSDQIAATNDVVNNTGRKHGFFGFLKDPDTGVSKAYQWFQNWGLLKPDALRLMGLKSLANNLELYGSVLAKHQGRIEVLEYDLINIFSQVKTVKNGNIVFEPSTNLITRKMSKSQYNDVKDILAVVTDVEMAKWLMTSKSKINANELFIDMYLGKKEAKKYKDFIKKAYDNDFNIRKETIEGQAIQRVRDYYKDYVQLLGDVARRVLNKKEYTNFVKLYGKNGEKWLEAYGHRRLSKQFLEYYKEDKANKSGNPHEIIFNDILIQEVGKLLKREHTKGKVDIDKMSKEELLEFADTHLIGGELVSDIARKIAIKRMADVFNINTRRISVSPLMPRGKDLIDFSYVIDPSRAKGNFIKTATKRILKLQEEIPTYEIGKDSFDSVLGGYNYSMAKLLSGLEFFKDYVHIEGVISGRRGRKALADALAKGEVKGITRETKDFVLKTLDELFDLGDRGFWSDLIHRKTLPFVGTAAKAQLGMILLPGLKNGLVGQTMNIAATPEGITIGNYIKWLDPNARLEVRRAGLTGTGVRIYDVVVPKYIKTLIDKPFELGGTRTVEYFNRYTTDAIVLEALSQYISKVKKSKLTPVKGEKVNASKELKMLKEWFNLSDKQIKMIEDYGVHILEPKDLVLLPEFLKIKNEKQRIDTAWDYANIIQKVRVLGAARTQGTTLRAFTPRFMDKPVISNMLLFKKMAYMSTIGSMKMMNMGMTQGSLIGLTATMSRMIAGNIASGVALETAAHYLIGREYSYEDEFWKRLAFYAVRGELFGMIGEGLSYGLGMNDKSLMLEYAPLSLASDVIGLTFDVADMALHPNSKTNLLYSDKFKQFGKNQSGFVRFIDQNINRWQTPFNKKVQDFRKRYFEFVDQDDSYFSEEQTSSYGPLEEPNKLGQYGFKQYGGVGKLNPFHRHWRTDAFNPLKYKKQLKKIFLTADFNNEEEWGHLQKIIGLYLTSQMVDFQKRELDSVQDAEEAMMLAREELGNYLNPSTLLGFDGLIYEPLSKTKKGTAWYPSEEKGDDGKPLYYYPKILTPLQDTDGNFLNGELGQWYKSQLDSKSKGTKKSKFWDFYKYLNIDKNKPEDASEYAQLIVGAQERIENLYKYIFTKSGMYDISYDSKSGKFYSNNPLHESLDLEQINEAYNIQSILFGEKFENLSKENKKELLFTMAHKKIEKIQKVSDKNDIKRLENEIKMIDKELEKLGVPLYLK